MNDIERRITTDTWPDADLAIRELSVPGPSTGRHFRGYAAVFDTASDKLPGPMGAFVERIKPGAFTKTIADRKNRVRMFVNHDTSAILASVKSGTLTLTEDERGLAVEAALPDTTAGRDLAVLIREGIVDSMSFGFTTVKDEWPSPSERTLLEVRLHEVSVVTGWPAYSATSATVRALAEESGEDPDELAECFRVLRDPNARLTSAQRDAIVRAINARTDQVVPTRLLLWQTTLAPKAPAA